MRVTRVVAFSLLILAASAQSQNQDSLLLDQLNKGVKTNDDVFLLMYVQGRISHENLFISSASYRVRFFEKRIRLIKKLRQQLRNKYALDYLVTKGDTTYSESHPQVKEDEQNEFRKVTPGDPRVEEAFVLLGKNYRLYRCPSFDGKQNYHLLTTGPSEPFERLVLFAADSSRPKRLDSFVVKQPGGRGSFSLDTINGGNIVRIDDVAPASGPGESSLHFLAVRDRKLTAIFQCKTAELAKAADGTTHRLMRHITREDLDRDGSVDITETVSDDIVDPAQGSDTDIADLKTIAHVSTRLNAYRWNRTTLTFDPAETK